MFRLDDRTNLHGRTVRRHEAAAELDGREPTADARTRREQQYVQGAHGVQAAHW